MTTSSDARFTSRLRGADTASERRALAARLEEAGVLVTSQWRAAVEAVPRELFLEPGVYLAGDRGSVRPYGLCRQRAGGGGAARSAGGRDARLPLAQLAALGAQLVRATAQDGARLFYLFDSERESFAEFTPDGDGNGDGWSVRQGGPVDLWDDVERTLTAWRDAGSPGISALRLRVTARSHIYWLDGSPALRWEHRHTRATS
ncbi:hypothetical protein AB0I22_18140 [Streptomyces sp. NPDC050610]|uniref:hypothetical protein n=1 Tax=Streptomyces sp. NPDC050610 TaxID=3157097 RepID=UPI003444EAF0